MSCPTLFRFLGAFLPSPCATAILVDKAAQLSRHTFTLSFNHLLTYLRSILLQPCCLIALLVCVDSLSEPVLQDVRYISISAISREPTGKHNLSREVADSTYLSNSPASCGMPLLDTVRVVYLQNLERKCRFHTSLQGKHNNCKMMQLQTQT